MVPGKQALIEILNRARKGTLDWETERMSPRPLRSQLKLYQSVENSVNENCIASIDLARKFALLCVIRVTDVAAGVCFPLLPRGIASRNFHLMSTHHCKSPSSFTNKIVAHGDRILILSTCKVWGAYIKMLGIGRLVGKMGHIPSMQQRAVAPFGGFIRDPGKFAFTVSMLTVNSG